MGIKETLIELSEASGVSGNEEPVRRIVIRELERFADDVFVTKLGSVVGVRRANGRPTTSRAGTRHPVAPKLMLEGHMDEIGLAVTAIDHGYIRFAKIGGHDPRALPSQNVTVHGRQELPGVIGARPPHVLGESERGKTTPIDELFIDVGLAVDRVRELITVGDVITIDRKVVALRNGFLAGKGFDDRAAVAVVIDTMRALRSTRLDWDVFAVANVQEEDGAWFVGASTSTFQILPDVAIALDVSHADQPGIGDVNVVPLDGGPGIAVGPNIHPLVHSRLVQVARAQEIPHRVTAYSGPTGTDAWAIQIVASGIPTGLIDLPLRYMHSSVETLALNDLDRTSRLLSSFASSLDDEFYRTLQGQHSQQVTKAAPTTRRSKRKQKR